jgi:hypothetical protein
MLVLLFFACSSFPQRAAGEKIAIEYDGQIAYFEDTQELTLGDIRDYFGVKGGGLKAAASPDGAVVIAKTSAILPSGDYILEVPATKTKTPSNSLEESVQQNYNKPYNNNNNQQNFQKRNNAVEIHVDPVQLSNQQTTDQGWFPENEEGLLSERTFSSK